MYRGSRNSRSNNSNRGYSPRSRGNSGGYGGNRSSRGGGRRGGGMPSFDPSALIHRSKIDQQNTPQEKLEAVYQSQYSFSDFEIHQEIKKNLAHKGYQTPTPVQDQIIPAILEGRDAVGIANTGTGKTAAFLIPLIDKVVKNPDTRVLIVTPTRELALQIRSELVDFSHNLDIYSTICIGGSAISRQIENLRRRPAFVIGTPGRLKDLNQRRKINFQNFNTIVLDEVDRMLDMGFVNEIREIINHLAEERQSLFFSATSNSKVEGIMQGFLKNPAFVVIKSRESKAQIEQDIVKINGRIKIDVLHDLLVKDEFQKVLVFGRTKHGMEKLSRSLAARGLKVASIHGNKSQYQRQKALEKFRQDQIDVLLATDVVARGLDIENITHVINYDLPGTREDYLHRIGRTGRANKAGVALSFID